MHTNFSRWCIAFTAMVFCSTAYAHPGHGSSYMAGIAHPLLGLDHLIAMLAVGLWASQIGGRANWMVPAGFVALMAVGGGAGMAGLALPLTMVESSIAISVLFLGLLIAFSVKVGPGLGAGIVGLFAVFHGIAHGMEMPTLATPLQYGIGFVTATVVLHALGVTLGRGLRQQRLWLRGLGILVAAIGGTMVVAI